MQRVLVVAFSVVPSPGRQSVGLVNHLKALAPRYAVDVVTVKSPDLPYVDRFMKTRMLRVPCGTGGLLEQVEAFRRAVRRQLDGVDYDVVHFRCPWGGRPVCERKGELQARTIFEVARSPEGEAPASDPAVTQALKRDEAFCLERADRIVVPTQAAVAYLKRRGLSRKVALVPPGVDVDLFDWEDAPEAQPPRILFAGRLGPARGVRLLLEAVKEVVKQEKVELGLAGLVDPGFEASLDEAIAHLGLTDVVKRLGAVEHGDLPRVIASATVCVAPHAPDSHDRPLAAFPSKVIEYLACRRATVAPRRVAVAEVLRDGEHGLLFTPGDVRDLADKILTLLRNPEMRGRLAEAGYRAVREARPASATRRALLEVYTRLAPPEAWSPQSGAPGPSTEIPSSPDTTTARRSFLGDSGSAPLMPELEDLLVEDSRPDQTRPDAVTGGEDTPLGTGGAAPGAPEPPPGTPTGSAPGSTGG
ncbi:MAG: glycosyltransferase family 4 protein [Deltaproteobacteria bacterium]|nr:glycosyltransferase family 4 protein [Deltaproteobacteria bacterium]